MAVVAALIFLAEKRPSHGGGQLSRVLRSRASSLLGVWVASAPGSVPGLTQPNSPGAAERARMRMMHEPASPGMSQMDEANQMQQSKPPMTTTSMMSTTPMMK